MRTGLRCGRVRSLFETLASRSASAHLIPPPSSCVHVSAASAERARNARRSAFPGAGSRWGRAWTDNFRLRIFKGERSNRQMPRRKRSKAYIEPRWGAQLISSPLNGRGPDAIRFGGFQLGQTVFGHAAFGDQPGDVVDIDLTPRALAAPAGVPTQIRSRS